MARCLALAHAALVAGSWSTAGAAEEPPIPADLSLSVNDFGGIGLLQTRTARFAPDGQFDFGASVIDPYIRYHLTWTILPWLEATFRYTDVQNRLYSDVAAFSGNQSFKDRGADLKLHLVNEGRYMPAVALGLQDGLGTGQFQSEYLVFSKRWYDLDFSGGIAWGYLGNRGTLRNPLRLFSEHFSRRGSSSAQGGTFNVGNYFGGARVGLFGGVEWRTPVEGLTVKLEYDSNDYKTEPLGNAFPSDAPVNVAAIWRPYPFIDLSLGFERGNTAMFRVGLRANLQDGGPPKSDPAPVPLKPRPPEAAQFTMADTAGPWWENEDGLASALLTGWRDPGLRERNTPARDAAAKLFDGLEREGLEIQAVELTRTDATITISRLPNGRAIAFNRVAQAVVQAIADPLERVTVVETAAGHETRRVTVITRDIAEAAIVDYVFDGFEEAGLPVESVELTETEATIAVAAPRGLRGVAAMALVGRVLDAAPMPVQRVTIVAHLSGREIGRISVSREEARREAKLDRLFAELQAKGVEVQSVDLSHRSATLAVASGGKTGDLAALGRTVAEALPMPLEAVTVVALANGVETARATYEPYAPRPTPSLVPVPVAGGDQPARPLLADPVKRKLAAAIFAELDGAGFRGVAFDLDQQTATVWVTPTKYRQVARNIGRAARILANHVPREVERLTIALVENEFETARISILRKDLEQAVALKGSPEEVFAHATFAPGETARADSAVQKPGLYPTLDWGLRPFLAQSVGQPEDFYLYQVNARLTARLDVGFGVGAELAINRKLFGTLDQARTDSNATLPHVRSDIRKYVQQAPTNLERLAVDWRLQPARNWYARLTGGLFEEMYGGFGGEVLWWPQGSPLALGGELFRVQQRDFDQRFRFRDYGVTTGFLNAYYQLPFYSLLAQISVGQYLAGDRGITYRLSREFDSGIRVGAFATLTDVKFSQFGEGSFDKGFFVSIPFETFLTQSTQRSGTLSFRPLTKDGGQMVSGAGQALYGMVSGGDLARITREWSRLLD